jgi:glucose-1-phosphate adenylyltransferase
MEWAAMGSANDLANDTLAVVLAGGKGTRLGALTQDVCKPAVPFGAVYRNIDFTLSNCVNSGLYRIGVATQHKPAALLRHLDEVWRDRITAPGGFIAPWPAEEHAPRLGYRGTADAVFRNLETIESLGSRLVLVLAGDHVYKMDYRPMLEYHCRRRADVTVGCVDVPAEEAHQFGILSVDGTGRVARFIEKPQTLEELPEGSRSVRGSMGIYVFDTDFLVEVLRRDAFSKSSRHDFGGDILPGLLREAGVFAYPFREPDGDEPAYWRDVGTPAAYWRAHMDLLGPSPGILLDDPAWPLGRRAGEPAPAASQGRPDVARHVADSVVADNCEIRGAVRRSVLFPKVVVADGADIADSVILPGAVVGRDCRLRGAIVTSGCRVPDGTLIGDASAAFATSQWEPMVVTEDEPSGRSVASYRH